MQVCSALICGTALGEVFEEGRGHNHESSVLRLRPDDSSGDSLGGHVGHAHVVGLEVWSVICSAIVASQFRLMLWQLQPHGTD